MRLDKFLKVARLAKRRSEAKAALEAGRITRGGRALKASHEVRPGDELVIHYSARILKVRVKAVPGKTGPKNEPQELYAVIEDA